MVSSVSFQKNAGLFNYRAEAMEDADKMIMREKIEDLQMWMGLKEVQRSLLGGGPHMTQDTGHGSPPDQVCEYYCARVQGWCWCRLWGAVWGGI